MTDRAALGKLAEDQAAAYLAAHGYDIAARNYRTRSGEIDIIARRGCRLVFVEVKARSGVAYGYPREAVTPAKQSRIVRAAAAFLSQRGLTESPARFDVIEVYGGEIVHWKNAFDASGINV